MVVVWREVLSDIEVGKHLLRFSAAPYIKEAAQFVRGKITPAQGTKSSGCGRTTGPHRSGGAAAFQDSFVCSDWCIQMHKGLEKMEPLAFLKNAFFAQETCKG